MRVRKFLRGRRGSYITEAAFIYPFIVIISAMLLLFMLFLFNVNQDAAKLSFNVRSAAGEDSGTVSYEIERDIRTLSLRQGYADEVSETAVSKEGGGLYSQYTSDVVRSGSFFSLIPVTVQRQTRSVWTSLDEDRIIRTADLIFEKISV